MSGILSKIPEEDSVNNITTDPNQSDSCSGTSETTEKVSATNGENVNEKDSQIKKSDEASASTKNKASPKAPNRPLLAPSKLGGFSSFNGSASSSNNSHKSTSSILAPSRLFVSGSAASREKCVNPLDSKFTLKPPVLGSSMSSNPFSSSKYIEKDDIAEADTDSDCSTTREDQSVSRTESGGVDTPTPPTTPTKCQQSGAAPNPQAAAAASGSSSDVTPKPAFTSIFGANIDTEDKKNGQNSSGSFVFGQNLHSRVSGAEEVTNGNTPSSTASVSTGNVFTQAASMITKDTSLPAKSLETSSRELAEKEVREKRKFEEVEVLTGEEEESNVLQMNCRIHGWVDGSWKERGRGMLRLNDWGDSETNMQSRLVARTQGTLIVILNTTIWGEMVVEKASPKSLRFTAAGSDGSPKIYLATGAQRDIELLLVSLERRVANAKKRESENKDKRAKVE